jgi:microsomal epoxide hydrolase
MGRTSGLTPLSVCVPQANLDRIRSQVAGHRWLDNSGVGGWNHGVDQEWFKSLGRAWATTYDWKKAEDRLNSFNNYHASIGGKKLHVIVEPGSGETPTPLLLLHGWPYSAYSFVDVIEPLAHPEKHGGRAEDAFDVVVVDHPGTGWSDAPDGIEGLRGFGKRYSELMTKVLGYDKYVVAGGDHGGLIAGWMGHDFPDELLGHQQHMFYPRHAGSPWLSGTVGPNPSEAEQAFVNREKGDPFGPLAYILTHTARGETLGAALHDNPVGQAAWLLDKWYYWADRRHSPLEAVVPTERLLDEVMIYVATDSFRTGMWPYIAIGLENVVNVAEGEMIANPCGVTAWPDPVFPLPPQEFVRRSRSNLIHYTTPARGGHFPMVEQPALFVEDMRRFGGAVRAFHDEPPRPPASRG